MKLKIRFKSLSELWQFKTTVKVTEVVVNSGEYALTGDFGEPEVELAKQAYGAEVVETQMAQKQ